MMTNGWTVFNNVSGSSATTNLLSYNFYPSANTEVAVREEPVSDDPLDWLHAKVDEVCELGHL